MNGEIYQGNSITVPFAQEGTLKGFEIQGKSIQETRSGKNLWNNATFATNIPVDAYEKTERGFIYTKGETTGGKWASQTINLKTGETITFSCTKQGTGVSLYLYEGQVYGTIINHTTEDNITYTADKDISIICTVIIDSSSISATIDNIQIEKNSTVTKYELYGAMPSPEFLSEIQSVGDNINLLNVPDQTVVSHGMTLEVKNNKYSISGTNTNTGTDTYIVLTGLNLRLTPGTYTMSNNSGNQYPYMQLRSNSEIVGTDMTYADNGKTTFTINKTVIVDTLRLYYSNRTGTSLALKIQKGAKATAYSEYGKGLIKIKQMQKNKFDYNTAIVYSAHTTKTVVNNEKCYKTKNSDGYNNCVIFQTNSTNLEENKQYTISFDIWADKETQFSSKQFYINSQTKAVHNLNEITTQKQRLIATITYVSKDATTHWLHLYPIYLEDNYIYTSNIQIEEGTQATEYEEYKGNNYIIPVSQPLRSLPSGIKDTIEEDGIHRRLGSIILDGSENWGTQQDKYHTETRMMFAAKINSLGTGITYRRGICNYFAISYSTVQNASVDKTAFNFNSLSNYSDYIYFKIDRNLLETEDIAGWKKWLAEHTPEVIYELTEETIEPFENPIKLSIFEGENNFIVDDDLKPELLINTADLVLPETPAMQAVLEDTPNEQTRINLEIWSHDDKFIDVLYNTDYEFEGQCIDPKMTLNANGAKTLTLSLPLYIIDKKTQDYIENPRWNYINQQYKIRVKQDDRINEFVLKDYVESHNADDQLMININAQSLEEFELSQIGYNVTFDENSLYRFNENEDPNDPDTVPIGTYEPDIHFWNKKLLENSNWDYRVESYYPIDKEMEEDNRQITNTELDYKNGKEQFYEEDRIIDYTEDNEPVYAEQYEIKKRVVKASKSNIFNIVQDICEAFECWPTFEIKYENEKIVKRTIVYKNDIPQDATFSINYQTNLNSIERTVDNSQIVTKMYVTPIQNENVDDGIVTIATNPKNFMKENYLLDLSWYLGDNRADTDIKNARLIDPKIGMHFVGTNFSEPLFSTTDTTTTKDTISTYERNIRSRNTYIENMSLQLSKDQEELINLKTEREYVQSQKDAIQETINTLIDEMSLIGTTELRKENKACYLYKQNDTVIIRFSEIGIKNVPSVQTFNTPINIISPDGKPYYDADKVPAGTAAGSWVDIKTLRLVPYKVDPIIGTILECQVTNGIIGTSTDGDYASFKCSFDYDPYEYYKKLISYWRAKLSAATDRLNVLGKSREDGGNDGLIYTLEGQIIEEKRYLFQAQQQKAQVVKEFESKFNPYIREGYWENTDFGIYMNTKQTRTYIPDEFKVLKYGQTEDSTSEETDKYDWSKDYVSFLIPNILINNGQGGTVYLYNVIDIDEIEVMNDNPLNANDNFRTYVKGTDYTVEYGYTSNTPGVTENNRGIYLRFYEPEINTNNDYIPQFTANTQIYIRVKARGNTQYLWSGYRKPAYFTEGGETKRCWYCPLEQRISIDDKDIILSSIVVKANTSKINYANDNSLLIENTQYELKYGKDYYTSKEIENGETVSRITFYQTTNVPLMDFQYANYVVEYNQDITAKYYYNDALEVMKESSIPQTTYSINVLDISEAENFLQNLKWYKPQVGIRVPIYDEELRFKGLVGFVNSVTFDLLNPQNTQLSITNFKDKFVDLFQKITASTIALQSKEYEYDRSTQIVTVEGGLNKDILKDTFERPDSNFTVTPNSNIKWDYSGITSTSDKLNENGVYAQVRVTPNGIFTANQKDEFGNYIWTTAITPQGINASQLTIGKLDTRQIQIFNSSEPRFMWNETGLYAYGQNEGKTDYETYVLYNENGLKFRQLMKSNKQIILPNLVKSPDFANLGDWTLSSTDNEVFDMDNTGIIQEIEIQGANPISVYQATIATNKTTNNISLELNSAKKDLVRDHKYYFRIYVKTNNIPELANIEIDAGFASFYKNIQYSQNNQYVKIDGFVTGVINENNFGIKVVLPSAISNWSVFVKKPMILDVTEIFGETIPSLQWFSDLSDIIEEGTWETELDVYGDALKLDWGGLTIGAQDNSLQLTSQNGLVIYHPITAQTNNEKRMRLQLGQWSEPAKDEYGNIITNGAEVVYEEMYGLRAHDLNGNMIFKISQRGVEFDFTDNLEQTIRNYSAEAALQAIASTNTSNLLKNSCGYVYEEERDPATGNPTGLYTFFDWEVENTNYLFPVNERYTQKDAQGGDVSIVEGTVSKHAFKMGGDTATDARPSIEQIVDVATTDGVIQPFTLKFLMKGISNLQTSSIKNGIHLDIFEAGNQQDISVDIPYVGNGGWQTVKYTIYTEMRQVTISIKNISTITVDGNNEPVTGVIYLSDLMFTSGQDTPAWTVSPGEVYNNYVTIGSEGVVVTSDKDATGSTVRTVMDSHSFRVETINANREVSTNILVDGDNTTLGPTHIKGQCDIGAISRLRFIENADLNVAVANRNPGVDITLIKG